MVFVAAGFLHYKSRKKKRRQAGNFQKTDSHALSAEHNDQTASLVTVDIPPMTDTARDTDIYADIRSSQMMESQSQALPKGNNLSIQTEEELMDLTIGYDGDYRNILASHSCGRSKEDDILKADKQENDYGIFEESCQYSVLSLRRNFDPSEMECYAVKQSLRRQLSHNNDDPYCLTNVWISEDHRSLDDCDSDSDASLSSKHSEDASQKSNRPQTQDETQSFN
ncbi:uncharacterized protein LOC134267214 [Saccostrea cucullata]|uniref:uncharacterized protein LOC134267214 n=1 Tax=Saccostrea cuccullata TaxID=36930 RepID=UPI002ED2507D